MHKRPYLGRLCGWGVLKSKITLFLFVNSKNICSLRFLPAKIRFPIAHQSYPENIPDMPLQTLNLRCMYHQGCLIFHISTNHIYHMSCSLLDFCQAMVYNNLSDRVAGSCEDCNQGSSCGGSFTCIWRLSWLSRF